jgi:dCTP deaminase
MSAPLENAIDSIVLSDSEIQDQIDKGIITIEPFERSLLRGGSVCLRLSDSYMSLRSSGISDISKKESYPQYHLETANADSGFIISARSMVLGSTMEKVRLPLGLMGWMSSLSGLARIGLQTTLSNLVGPGFGEDRPSSLTLELLNHLDNDIRIYPGMRICHLMILALGREATVGYDRQIGTYSRQVGPRGSQFYTEFT